MIAHIICAQDTPCPSMDSHGGHKISLLVNESMIYVKKGGAVFSKSTVHVNVNHEPVGKNKSKNI